jgi:hypothetical protein
MEKGSWVAKAPLGQHARDKNRRRFGFNRGEKPVSDKPDFILQLVDWAKVQGGDCRAREGAKAGHESQTLTLNGSGL